MTLSSLDRAVLPVVLAMVVVDVVLLRRSREGRRISDDAARGQRELER